MNFIEGQSVEISLEVTNNGPDSISLIVVSASLTNLTINSVSGAGCTSLPCNSLLLANGNSLTIMVMATIINSGQFGLDATVRANNSFDPVNVNNTSSFVETANVITIEIFKNSFE